MQFASLTSLTLSVLLPLAACQSAPKAPEMVHLPADNPAAVYSGSVGWGGFCFVAGKLGQRGGSFAREADTAINAVEVELARSGLTLADVVLCNVYLTDIDRYGEFNEIYAERFPKPYPARVCVAVQELPGNAQVEIQATARRHKSKE